MLPSDRWRRAVAIAWIAATSFTTAVRAQASGEEPSQRRLTIDRLYSLPHLIGNRPTGPAWSPDSRSLAFLWNEDGGNFRDVWMVDVASAEPVPRRLTRMPRLALEPTSETDPVSRAQVEERLERAPGVTDVVWHPDGRRLLLVFRGDLWSADLEGGAPLRLTTSEAPESRPAFSPDGRALAFLLEGNVWTMPAHGAGDDGPIPSATRRTGLFAQHVDVRSFRWSPDGDRIAILLADETEVPERAIPDYLTPEPELVRIRRAYPGEETARLRLGWMSVVDQAATGAMQRAEIQWLDLAADRPAQPDLILGYAWSPDGKYLAADTSDYYAKDRIVLVAPVSEDGDTGPARVVARDRDPDNETFYFWRIAWSPDSGLLYFLSDREGDYHVWMVAPESEAEPRRLTSGAWAVAEIHPVVGGLIAVGNLGAAEERQMFYVCVCGGEPLRVSGRAGTHSPTVSPDGRFAAVEFSSDTMPPELLLTRLDGPEDDVSERRLTDSPIEEFDDYRWVRPTYVSFPSHVDGTTLHGRLTLPPDFDPDRRYPAILGSVYTDSVRNQWGGRTAHPTWGLDQYLAQEGYVLLNVDMRGSWGRGREHRRGIRLDYGGMDIEDLESGVRYLGTLGYVDLERVGIWGSSYGGLMTAMSLFRKPGLYAAGVAGAPATNVWHALSGQMAVMMRPEDSPDEYADSSPFLHAQGLEDPLMIIHGMRDRVVLFKDSVTLVQRLILLGKDVDFVVLPDAGHGWDNEGLAQTRFAFKKLIQHFDRYLKTARGTP